jgi:hypothetical protein
MPQGTLDFGVYYENSKMAVLSGVNITLARGTNHLILEGKNGSIWKEGEGRRGKRETDEGSKRAG